MQGVLRRNVKRFRRGLVFKAHRLLHHSTIGSTLKRKEEVTASSMPPTALLSFPPDGSSPLGFRVWGLGFRI